MLSLPCGAPLVPTARGFPDSVPVVADEVGILHSELHRALRSAVEAIPESQGSFHARAWYRWCSCRGGPGTNPAAPPTPLEVDVSAAGGRSARSPSSIRVAEQGDRNPVPGRADVAYAARAVVFVADVQVNIQLVAEVLPSFRGIGSCGSEPSCRSGRMVACGKPTEPYRPMPSPPKKCTPKSTCLEKTRPRHWLRCHHRCGRR